jgi:hypothetical protein
MVDTHSNPGEHESYIHIEGILDFEEQQHVIEYVGRLGLSATYVGNSLEESSSQLDLTGIICLPETQREIIKKHGYRFSDIQNTDDILVREHFEDLGIADQDVDKRSLIRAFHQLMDKRGIGRMYTFDPSLTGQSKMRQIREPKPLDGIVIVRREEIGLPPYKTGYISEKESAIMAQYGMKAGSVLSALEKAGGLNTSNKVNKTHLALSQVALNLKQQLQQ